MWPRSDGVALVGPNQHVNPVTKIYRCIQKARARHAHAKCFEIYHPVSKPGKICTHAQACQRNARRRSCERAVLLVNSSFSRDWTRKTHEKHAVGRSLLHNLITLASMVWTATLHMQLGALHDQWIRRETPQRIGLGIQYYPSIPQVRSPSSHR